ncbi:YeeE/YedE family protein [Rhizobiales bacterium]|uniref:YeeE/YedE family protein n=1 Tax=Hongsoonwoonella zoysiae TaxID=2821844 RepID=UPI0015606DB3|nr:YeeE/YedE family protein [Hongsoonwoonella zoysiae]NRG19303.1 YeeE/YedE family protein [Hongsoonwoonella zoysiae]
MEEWSPGTIAALGGFAGGCLLGFAARWGRFCTLGAIEDACFGADTSRIRMWGLAIAVAIAGTYGLDFFGFIDVSQSFYIASPVTVLATIAGGLMFGIGMAFVGTCGFGTLARIGGGDLKSVVTFLVMGITAYATVRGAGAYLRVAAFPDPGPRDTPASFAHSASSMLGGPVHLWALIFAAILAGFCLASPTFRTRPRLIASGLLVGVVVTSGWFVTGYLAPDEFETYPLESFTFSAPLGEAIMYVMVMSGATLKFGIGAVFGVLTGAAVTTLAQRYFRWEACDDAREMRRQIMGGMLMGFGSVTALGCTIGQGVSAASMLAWSAPVALVSIFIGAYLGLHILVRGSVLEPLKDLILPLWHRS